jgi:hypothetical protein
MADASPDAGVTVAYSFYGFDVAGAGDAGAVVPAPLLPKRCRHWSRSPPMSPMH